MPKQLTLEDISTLLDTKLEEKLSTILDTKLAALTETIINEFERRVKKNEDDIVTLNQRVSSLETLCDGLRGEIIAMKDDLDDQVNRGMRNNMIIKGLPESLDNEREDTRSLVVNKLHELSGDKYSKHGIDTVIDRAHRGSGKPRTDRPRNIYIRFTSSQVVDEYLYLARKLKSPLRLDRQFSKAVTDRRKVAMLERKKLKEEKTIMAGYLEYPAKLMVKYTGQNSFKLHKEF